MSAPLAPLVVTVHFDFASSLCCVAHRVMERIVARTASLGLALRWSPLDLTRLGPWVRGVEVPAARRAHARAVAEALGVSVPVPRVWPDSRAAGAAAILAEAAGREASWRERVFSALFDEGREVGGEAAVQALAADLGWRLDAAALHEAHGELEARTLEAADAEVTGVPTFMLGRWPFGGIQTDDTMLRVLERFAARARRGELA